MRITLGSLMLSAGLLSACNQSPLAAASVPKSQGRYAGIGTFDAGRLWAQMAGAPISKEKAPAQIADDEHIIVVLDSHTGEVRQCGDHSGYCVTMNPWNRDAGSVQSLPANLEKHAADLATEDDATTADPIKSANASSPVK